MNNCKIYEYDAVVVGTGAAGYSGACRIRELGQKSVALVTEGIACGTSRNTGSDKQTYYKLGLGGDAPDSVRRMAANLFAGGSVDGDNALCEAALSARCFLRLAELGVPFPVNCYGEYIGYKTDHDPYARATSAGPLTSRYMTEALERQARALNIPVYDNLLALEILKNDAGVCGLLCMEQSTGEFVLFRCGSILLATGGPAGIYADSVYPIGHTGASGLLVEAGAAMQNLTEWQFGLASVSPRWNVSGTYMQVLPRFVSVGKDGAEREFLSDYFADPYEALSAVFLKGYQWPFDSRKVLSGSSVIDLLVYQECVLRRRRVYLDYTKNPFGLAAIDFDRLSPEAHDYLARAGACFGTPIERLAHMNRPAIALYQGKGLDLTTEMLEIALCAQHHNGGASVNLWWETTVPGLFAAGECAGTHGITRPGGSALNAGQVGALRAAQYISVHGRRAADVTGFSTTAVAAVEKHRAFRSAAHPVCDADTRLMRARRRMSDRAGAIRVPDALQSALTDVQTELTTWPEVIGPYRPAELVRAYKLRDTLLMQEAVLTAMLDYARTVGATRGSALYWDCGGDLRPGLSPLFRFTLSADGAADRVQEVRRTNGQCTVRWRKVRPLPTGEDFFENVWRQYRVDENVHLPEENR